MKANLTEIFSSFLIPGAPHLLSASEEATSPSDLPHGSPKEEEGSLRRNLSENLVTSSMLLLQPQQVS